MPFVEVEKNGVGRTGSDLIYITENRVVIGKKLIQQFFKDITKLSVFIDGENKKIGLKPNADGPFKIMHHGHTFFCCSQITKNIKGHFTPTWDAKQGMLIFDYEKKP